MQVSLSRLLQMYLNRLPFRYFSFNISKYCIYFIGLIYFLINNNEMKLIIGAVNYVLQKKDSCKS
jgi:hypothetical protein